MLLQVGKKYRVRMQRQDGDVEITSIEHLFGENECTIYYRYPTFGFMTGRFYVTDCCSPTRFKHMIEAATKPILEITV